MLLHGFEQETAPEKAVVMGAGGFVGQHIVAVLSARSVETVALTRREVDLLAPGAADAFARHLSPDTALVVTSAIAPAKDYRMLHDNIVMIKAVCDAVRQQPVAHIVYVSSDAVFADSDQPLTESSPKGAENTHGIMHAAREVMLTDAAGKIPRAFLRPTLIYGAGDPHNGYGPNRFRRLALSGEDIVLFGEGEERRDHVAVEDVAELACRIVLHRSSGSLNAATGEVISFRDLAELTVALASDRVSVKGSPRSGPMPHNGYRPFDASATMRAFPSFCYVSPRDGVERAFREAEASKGA